MSGADVLSPQEALEQLGMDEDSINKLIMSSGVEVPTVLWPTAKLLAADILLGSVLAADLDEGASFSGVLSLLTVARERQVAHMLPALSSALLDLCEDESPAVAPQIYEDRIRTLRGLFA
jgi:hypothetical protein